MRCLIYARVSLDPRADARSTQEQEAECRAWAAREGWSVTHVITETGSASRYARSTRARTQWDTVTQELATGHYDALLTWEASRATRDLTAYAALRDLCATHRVAWGYSGTLYDLTTRDHRFRTGLDALLAEDEAARTSDRVRRAVRARATAGQPHGKLLYGYMREYDTATRQLIRQAPHPDTAAIVRDIYTRAINGQSQAAIARHLTAQGVAPPRPRRTERADPQQWLPSTVRRIITNPAYAGHRTHHGQIVAPAAWEPLVTQDVWDQANAAIAYPPTHARNPGGPAKHLLSGIATCGPCGSVLYAITNRGYLSYQCSGCMGVTRRTERLDAYVVATLQELLRLEGHRIGQPAPTDGAELAAARAALKDLTDRHASFLTEAAAGRVAAASLARIEQVLNPQIAAAERAVRRLQTPTRLRDLDIDRVITAWDGIPLAEQRAIIADTLTIRVLPVGRGRRGAPMADGADITPLWHHQGDGPATGDAPPAT